jgi:hypothetical protein
MQQDKQLRQILLNSAEGASPGFTDAVMKRVNDLSATRLNYQPLAHPKWQRIFVFTFGALVASIFALSLIIALMDSHVFSWIQRINLPNFKYDKVLEFIIIFWFVFSVYALLKKRYLPHRRSFMGLH